MLRTVIYLSLGISIAGTLGAGIWPDQWKEDKRTGSRPASLQDTALAEEYGFEAGETADYSGTGGKFSATAFRFKDSTGALAAYDSIRPSNAKPSGLMDIASSIPGGALLAYGNYVVRFDGATPESADLLPFLNHLPRLYMASLPPLLGFFPKRDLVPNSDRYILGPASLERFSPRVSASMVGFHQGAEGQIARFQGVDGPMELAVFVYPTPHIARARLAGFQMLPQSVAKRTGPLVAVVLNPSTPDAAERLLALVNYKATVTWNQEVPKKQINPGQLILDIMTLSGVLILLSVGAGIVYAGIRIYGWKFGKGSAGGPMTVLDLNGK